MAGLKDVGDAIFGFARKLAVVDEKFQRQADDIKALRDESSKLRDMIGDLAKRVAVLEEGRKTTESDTKRTMTEVIANWERQSHEQERVRLQEEISQLRRGLPSKNE